MHTIILYNIRALNIILLFESVYGIRSYKLCILYIQYIICIQIVCILRARTRGVYESYSTSKYVVYIHTMHMHHTSRVCIHASRPSLAQMHPPGLNPGVIESWLRGWDPGGRLYINICNVSCVLGVERDIWCGYIQNLTRKYIVPSIVMLYFPGLGSWTLALFGGEEKAMQWIFARC